MQAAARWMSLAALAATACGTDPKATDPIAQPASATSSVVTVRNPSGVAQTLNASGGPVVDAANPFFQSLGTNGRSCATCHDASDNMTVTPQRIQARFAATGGTDPIFRTVDGSNSPTSRR